MTAALDQLRRLTHRSGFIGLDSVLLLAILWGGCGSEGEHGASAEPAAANTGSARVVNVEVSTIELGDLVDFMRITGEVEAFQRAVLSAEEADRKQAVPKGNRLRLRRNA